MASWLIACCILAAGPEAKIAFLDGAPATGKLLEITAEQVSLETSAGKQTFPAAKILSLDLGAKPAAAEKGLLRLELLDGSRIFAKSYTVDEGVVKFNHAQAGDVETRTRALRYVRMKDPDPALEKSWEETLTASEKAAGDVLVVRKTTATGSVLDYLDGTIGEVTPTVVKFKFGGMSVDVKRERIEALIYFQPAGRQLVDPVARIEDFSGSSWNAKALTLAGDKIQLTTTGNVKAELPLDKIASFDFSAGKVLSLVGLQPEVEQWTPFLAGPKPIELVAKLFRPRKGIGFDGQPLRLKMPDKVQEFPEGLAIHSRTELVYRLPNAYRRFTAVAGIDERLGQGGHVRLEISGDGKVLYDAGLGGGQTAVPLEIDLAGVRRLRILVDFGENLDIKDQLNLVNPRMWK